MRLHHPPPPCSALHTDAITPETSPQPKPTTLHSSRLRCGPDTSRRDPVPYLERYKSTLTECRHLGSAANTWPHSGHVSLNTFRDKHLQPHLCHSGRLSFVTHNYNCICGNEFCVISRQHKRSALITLVAGMNHTLQGAGVNRHIPVILHIYTSFAAIVFIYIGTLHRVICIVCI